MKKRTLTLAVAVAMAAGVGVAMAQQVVRVGMQDAQPNVVRKDNQVSGTVIEIWEAIAKEAGFRVEFIIRENNNQAIELMEQGKLDVVAGSTDTPANRTRFTLSVPYGTTAEGLIVPKTDTKQYKSAADIKGLNFVTLRGSIYADYLKSIGAANFKEVDTTTECLTAVSAGQANAAFFSGVISGFTLKQGLFPDLRFVESYQPALARPYVMAFSKTPTGDIVSKTDGAIQKLRADGTIGRIFAKYGVPQ